MFLCCKTPGRTSVFLHGVRFDYGQRALLREEEADLSFCVFGAQAAMKLVDNLIFNSKLGP